MKPTGKRLSFWVGLVVFGVFFVILLTLLVWRLRLASQVNRHLATVRTAGLPTSGAELNAFYPYIPDSENAALVLTQAFALMRDLPDSRSNAIARLEVPSRHHSLGNQEVAWLTEYVDLNSNALTRARSAAKLGKSRYPLDYTPGFETLLPHLPKLKRLAKLEEFRSVVALNAGRATEASDACIGILNLARTLDEEPCLISQLVRMAMLGIAERSLERRANLAAFTSAELDSLAAALAAVDKKNLITRALIGERALGIPHFRMTWSQIKRLSRDDENEDDGFERLPDSDRQPLLLKSTGFFERDLLVYLQTLETNLTVAARPPPQSLLGKDLFEAASEKARKRYCILSAMLFPALSKATERAAESPARLRLAQTAVAIEKFFSANGHYPDGLRELLQRILPVLPIDPFDGHELRYKRSATGYLLYCVGNDRKDDGGRERPLRIKSTDRTSYDITFTVER